MLSISSAATLGLAPTVMPAPTQLRATAPVMESKADLEALASELNPVVGFWDPLGLSEAGNAEEGGFLTNEAAIGYLRHSEIKHGRIAMAAFVGFIVQSNGIHFPWALTSSGITYADIAAAGGPADQWDALPTAAKLQIFGAIGFLEGWGENYKALAADGQSHYMRGGKPGFFPSFKNEGVSPSIHPMPLDLWDPFGFTKKMTAEKKATALKAEINNGRLAMIGIMGFVSASKGLIVPGMDTLGIKPYAGEVMAPFASGDSNLLFVSDMLGYVLPKP